MRKKLLLIDDDEAILAYLSARLAHLYEVVGTSEPRVAVAMAAAEKPDVVLCDVDMPAMDGGEVAKALAADRRTSHIPLIYLTALLAPGQPRGLPGQLAGRPGVSKSAKVAELVARIDEASAA
jgi:CheY-like chemotaxis protein